MRFPPKALAEALLRQWPAKIISLAAAVVLFMFYRANTLEERFLSVPLKVINARGLAIASSYPRNVRVTLRGHADIIFPIQEADIEVQADLSRYRVEGRFRVPLQVVRRGTAEEAKTLTIRLEPPEITVTLEHQVEKSVRVDPVLKGSPAHGYELARSILTPSMVEVIGPRSQMQGLSSVGTDEVDLTGRTEDFSLKVRLQRKSSLLEFPGGSTATYQGIIHEVVIQKTFSPLDPVGIDIASGMKLALPFPQGSVTLQGGQIAVEGLSTNQVRLVADCSRVGYPGEHVLPVRVEVPPGFVVLSYEPREVRAIFQRSLPEGRP